jgi:hypothetical protein
MSNERLLSRRSVLKGIGGAAIGLPFLESMSHAHASVSMPLPPASSPLRMAFVYVPNGMHMPYWTPKETGADYQLPASLEALSSFRKDFTIISGLTCDKARSNGDGAGDHARAMSAFLTCTQPKKTAADIRVGISVDQLAAQQIGTATKLPSLEIGCDRGANAGNCDSGYSCAYSNNLSWRSESTPMPKEVDPRQVFERLYGVPKNYDDRLSVLDSVLEDAKGLQQRLGGADRHKLDEYLTSVREIEARMMRNKNDNAKVVPPMDKPTGVPKEYSDHIKMLTDLMVLAFQADLTRVCTFALANEGSNKSYKFIGVSEGHHDLSHHGGDKDKHEKIARINQFHIKQLGYLLERLQSVKEGQGTLLDNLMLVYGSGIGDGNRHNHDELPVLLAGKAGGALHPGRHLRVPKETPIANLYLSMLERLGINQKRFGDSTGKLENL